MAAAAGVTVSSFEEIAIPLFATQGLAQLKAPGALDAAARAILAPFGLSVLYAGAAAAASNNYGAVQTAWATADTQSGANVLCLSAAPQTGAFDPNVVAGLWDNTNTMSFLNSAGYQMTVAALQEASAPGAAMQAYATAFATAFAQYDPAYATTPLHLQEHVGLVLGFVGAALTAGSPLATAMQTAIASQMHAFGLLDNADWTEVVPAQLGSNAVTGLMAWLTTPSVQAFGYAPTPVTGVSILNRCPTGSSLDDQPAFTSRFATYPEFSCWSAREPTSFGTRIPSAAMKTALTALTSGPAMLPVLTGPAFAGTGAAAQFLGTVAALKAQLSTAPLASLAGALGNVMQLKAAFLTAYTAWQANPASSSLLSAMMTAEANYASAQAAVPCATADTLSLGLSCPQLLDLAAYMNHIAKKLVWEPTFVNAPPRVWSNSASNFVTHPDPYYAGLAATETNSIRAGPFIRCTVREFVETGCHDNFLDYVAQLLRGAPAGYPASRVPTAIFTDYSGAANDAAWTAYKTGHRPDSRYTGETDINMVDVIYADAGDTDISTFGGPAGSSEITSPVYGSYSGVQFAPLLTLTPNYNAAPAKQTVWVWQGRRPVDLKYIETVNDPSGNVKLWRYRLAPAAADWSDKPIFRMKTDEDGITPLCAANVAALSNGATVFLAKPYFVGCENSVMDWTTDGYDYADATFAAAMSEDTLGTHVDIEPITGLVMNANKRLGAHLYWGASPWFPALRTTYGLVYYLHQFGAIAADKAKTFQETVEDTQNLKDKRLPAGLLTVGILVVLATFFFAVRSWRRRRLTGPVTSAPSKAEHVAAAPTAESV